MEDISALVQIFLVQKSFLGSKIFQLYVKIKGQAYWYDF